MKYKEKPVTVEAFCFGRDAEVPSWFLNAISQKKVVLSDDPDYMHADIEVSEGNVQRAEVGDYVVKGVDGGLFPLKPTVFNANYEAVEA